MSSRCLLRLRDGNVTQLLKAKKIKNGIVAKYGNRTLGFFVKKGSNENELKGKKLMAVFYGILGQPFCVIMDWDSVPDQKLNSVEVQGKDLSVPFKDISGDADHDLIAHVLTGGIVDRIIKPKITMKPALMLVIYVGIIEALLLRPDIFNGVLGLVVLLVMMGLFMFIMMTDRIT